MGRVGWLACGILVLWISVCLVPQFYVSAAYTGKFLPFVGMGGLSGDGVHHWLGTDHAGQDVYAYLVWDGRQTLLTTGFALLMSYLAMAIVAVPIVVGAVYGHAVVRAVCVFFVSVCESVPIVLVYVCLWWVLPSVLALSLAIAVGGTAGLFALLVEYKGHGFDLIGRRSAYSMLIKLFLADLLERSRLTFVLLLSLQFVGFWNESGWGSRVREAAIYAWPHPEAVLPYIVAIFSVALALGLLSATARRGIPAQDLIVTA